MKQYLMLDTEKYLEEVGIITERELFDELQLNKNQIKIFLDKGSLFREKFVLVEKEFNDHVIYEERYITKYKDIDYYISNKGNVYSERIGKRRELSMWIRDNKLVTKVANKEVKVAYLVAKHFIREYYDGCIVMTKDENPYNVDESNLEIFSRSEISKRNALMNNKCKKKVGVFEQDKLIRTFASAKEASIALHYNYSSVRDTLKGRIKRPYYDLRYI